MTIMAEEAKPTGRRKFTQIPGFEQKACFARKANLSSAVAIISDDGAGCGQSLRQGASQAFPLRQMHERVHDAN